MFEDRLNWFRPKRFGWGISPTNLKGWLYTSGWTASILGPGILLLRIRKPIFALIWMSGLTVACMVDVWLILRQMKKANSSPAHRRL